MLSYELLRIDTASITWFVINRGFFLEWSSGAAAPAEIGQFMAPQGVMYVVGNSLVFPIYQLKEWRMLRTAYYQISPNETRRCDFTHLKDAARLLCSLELDASHSFLNPITQKLITLNTHTYDYCYKSVYALALLDSINVQKGDVQVQDAQTQIRTPC